MKLSLAFSPCPNDCFMFDAIVNRRIDLEGLEFDVTLADIEALNHATFANGGPDVTKLSFHAYAYCTDRYVLLDAGSALGRNCGPLLISRRPIDRDEVAQGNLSIAIPGKYTTANFLCGLAFPAAQNKTEVLFSDIEPALLEGRFDAGVIIHENRFTYQAKGLRKIVDMGEFWESETGAPIPLGGIVVKRSLPDGVKQAMNRVMRRSVEYAFAHRDASLPYVRAHAQEMSEEVMYQHIDLYVNEYSVDLGWQGRNAVQVLFDRARRAGIVPDVPRDLFLGRNLVSITPFFIVKDLQASIAYYRERLGFQLDVQGPEGSPFWAIVSRDNVSINLKSIARDVLPMPNHTRHEWARWDAYIYTLDPDTLFNEFRERGVPFVKELSFIDPGLWGFEITDGDGYVLAFFCLRDE